MRVLRWLVAMIEWAFWPWHGGGTDGMTGREIW